MAATPMIHTVFQPRKGRAAIWKSGIAGPKQPDQQNCLVC